MPAGYPGRSLAAKLGLKAGQRIYARGMPESVRAEIATEMPGVAFAAEPEPGLDLAHIFVASRAELEQSLAVLRPLLSPAGTLWVSWPKKASKVATDVGEDAVREAAFPHGLVDVKVCAVDETWSGLKLVIRKALRG
jgi:hypothetical protein